METRLMRDFAKCLTRSERSPDRQALVEIVERLDTLHPSPEATALVSESIALAYRIGKQD